MRPEASVHEIKVAICGVCMFTVFDALSPLHCSGCAIFSFKVKIFIPSISK